MAPALDAALLMPALVAASEVRRRVPALVAALVLRRKVAALDALPRGRSVERRVGKVPAIQGRAPISKDSITTSISVLLVLRDAMADGQPRL